MARLGKEEAAVVKSLGDSGQAIVDLVNAKSTPLSLFNDWDAWRSGVDTRLDKLDECCEAKSQASKPVTTPRPVIRHQPTTQPDRGVRSSVDLRTWGWLEWLLAIAGLFAGLVAAKFTFGWIVWLTDPIDWLGNVLIVIWWIALAVLGFFLGGEIGSRIRWRQRH